MKKIVFKNEEMFPEVSKMLEDGHKVTIPVKGYSMLPTIVGERDLVVLEASDHYSKNDIVLFCLGGKWILHRVIKVDAAGERFAIRGDGIARSQEHCRKSDIKGRVVTILKKGNKPVNPYSGWQLFRLGLWNMLRPIRRYILYIYRHLPWKARYFRPDA
ncbi:MAG: S24/S26 family peptidase [Bacteroidales bacterium]|nr:S24/S26 family peptidase [Bacteroidales bacterium]